MASGDGRLRAHERAERQRCAIAYRGEVAEGHGGGVGVSECEGGGVEVSSRCRRVDELPAVQRSVEVSQNEGRGRRRARAGDM